MSARELKLMYVREFGEQPDRIILREHRAFEKALRTLKCGTVKEGHRHFETVRNPHVMIQRLVKKGFFEPDCIIGRQNIGTMKRTALNVKTSALIMYEEELKDWIEDQGLATADEGYAVLLFAAMVGGLKGFGEFRSPYLKLLAETTKRLPDSCVQVLLTSSENLAGFFSHK